MISNQVIQTSIEELTEITKVELAVYDLDGSVIAMASDNIFISKDVVESFGHSIADSQIVNGMHLLKIFNETELTYILVATGNNESSYMIGKIAVSQIQQLLLAYKERLDKNNFFQNLILDNLLLVDIYNRAQKFRIDILKKRVVYLIETKVDRDNGVVELLRGLFSTHNDDHIVMVDEQNVILVKSFEENLTKEVIQNTAKMIVDMLNTEAMLNVRVSYGMTVSDLKEVSKSYKEAKMAMDVGKIFYMEQNVTAYENLGIGRLIYQLPYNLCDIFMKEIFGDTMLNQIDEETLTTVNKFFENHLNVSETSRQLFIHRNTLVYRIEKLEKATGLDIRKFDDALTFKIALMVVSYLKYLKEQN
ncbi:MAG: PucR family transcriptional regulator [Lachnospiraceae bacterium]